MRSRRLLVALAVALSAAALLASGCGGTDDEDETAAAEQAQAVPPLPDTRPGGAIPVEAFNQYLADEKPEFAASALRTAAEFVHAGEGQAAKTSVVSTEGPEGGADEASVTVTHDGLADDSIRAIRYLVVLERGADGTWRVRSALRSQRCQPGRGHEDFSPELCT